MIVSIEKYPKNFERKIPVVDQVNSVALKVHMFVADATDRQPG